MMRNEKLVKKGCVVVMWSPNEMFLRHQGLKEKDIVWSLVELTNNGKLVIRNETLKEFGVELVLEE